MASEEYKARKAAYVKRYQKETYTNISFKVRTVKDKDILDILNSVPNKSLFLKELIRNAKLPKQSCDQGSILPCYDGIVGLPDQKIYSKKKKA